MEDDHIEDFSAPKSLEREAESDFSESLDKLGLDLDYDCDEAEGSEQDDKVCPFYLPLSQSLF
jgi:hypothetical protein